MQLTKAASRYARSLFMLASDRNEVDAVNKDMELIDKTIRASKDLGVVLKSPVIKPDKKIVIMNLIFGEKIGKTTKAFLELIIRKRREMYIEGIARQFVLLYLENNNIEEAIITTPHKIDDVFRRAIIGVIEKHTHHKVQLEERIDPDVIGGFILRFGDKQLDASIATELELLRRVFNKNLYVKDY